MQTISFFGYICPQCRGTIDIGAVVGGGRDMICSKCKIPMVPNPNGQMSAANVYCENCIVGYGIINSDKCPQCGGQFSRLVD